MNHPPQITAAPTTIRMEGDLYLMSPLTDQDVEFLDNAIRAGVVRMARDVSALMSAEDRRLAVEAAADFDFGWTDSDWSDLAEHPEFRATIIWAGLRRNHPTLSLSDVQRMLIADPGAAEEAAFEFRRINSAPAGSTKKPDGDKPAKYDKSSLYRMIAKLYGWTAGEIAQMTPAQQMMMIADTGTDARTGQPTRRFQTLAEAEAFRRQIQLG